MSAEATAWAWSAPVTTSAQRLVLLSFADHVRNGQDTCFPSNKTVASNTRLNVKTVQKVVNELVELGLIMDTGERIGRTNQVRIIRLVGIEKLKGTQNWDSSNDTNFGIVREANAPKNGIVEDTQKRIPLDNETHPKTGTLPILTHPKTDTFPEETIPKTGSLEGERYPILEAKVPNFGLKGTQNWDRESLINLLKNLSIEKEKGNWIPDLGQLAEKLKFAGHEKNLELIFGLPSFVFEVDAFNSHYENLAMSDSKKLHKFVPWIIDKFDRYKKSNPEYGSVSENQSHPVTSGNTSPSAEDVPYIPKKWG